MQFGQPDTVIPNVYNPQSWNRYSYVLNDPINNTDPSGNLTCRDDDIVCLKRQGKLPDSGDIPTVPDSPFDPGPMAGEAEDTFGDYYRMGYQFVGQLRNHPGWWTQYLNGDSESVWTFLLALAFSFEGYSSGVKNSVFLDHMTNAFINKAGSFYSEYSTAGLYAYIGSRESIFDRIYSDDAPQWNRTTGEYLNAWDMNYLGMKDYFDQGMERMQYAWPLITNYNGGPVGIGEYDYGIVPPMEYPHDIILLNYDLGIYYNIWTDKVEDNRLVFIRK
jgi:hypothetical protein